MRQELTHLQGEKTLLKRMIDETPLENVLDRGSLTARLEEIEERINLAELGPKDPVRARLTFSGKPVISSYGIRADFGTKIIGSFNETVLAVAASISGGLAAKGPIPNRYQNQLLITNTALGSFGFELEENIADQLTIEERTTLDLAIERLQNLLQGTIETDDELLADSASELDQRALDKTRTFIDTLAENEAICTLQFRNQTFRFTDVGQVRSSLARISKDNIHEEEQNLKGEFLGVLPRRRTFEFKIDAPEQVIAGKFSPAVEYADNINKHLNQLVNIRVMATTVRSGKPRYQLLELPAWINDLKAN
jgi:hypothetical protein